VSLLRDAKSLLALIPPSQTRFNKGVFLTFKVIIKTNQVSVHKSNDISYITNKISRMLIESSES